MKQYRTIEQLCLDAHSITLIPWMMMLVIIRSYVIGMYLYQINETWNVHCFETSTTKFNERYSTLDISLIISVCVIMEFASNRTALFKLFQLGLIHDMNAFSQYFFTNFYLGCVLYMKWRLLPILGGFVLYMPATYARIFTVIHDFKCSTL